MPIDMATDFFSQKTNYHDFQKKSYKSLIFSFSIERNTLFFGLNFSVSTTEFKLGQI